MKKRLQSIFFLCILILNVLPLSVHADTSYLIKSPTITACSIKTAPNEGGSWLIPGTIHYLDTGDKVTVISGENPTKSTSSKCKSSYYPVYFSGLKGYVCGDYIEFNTSGKYDAEWEALNFPKNYWPYLNMLKEKHTNWTFTPLFLDVEWSSAVQAESRVGMSLINSTNQGWYSMDDLSYNRYTDTFYDNFDGKGWFAANSEIIAYYMDPRNFLNENNVFMFESLTYSNSHKVEVVQSILKDTFMSANYIDTDGVTRNYAETFMEVGRLLNVSPYLLATRAKQEVVKAGQPSGSASGTVAGYEGYFNFFNIGAYAHSGRDAIANGLEYAKTKGWNSRYKSIYGGAETLSREYIAIGQNNLYLQKWDMIGNLYTHQYMSNIMAPKSESLSMFQSYQTQNVLGTEFNFSIPVYKNMPEVTEMPSTGNPNNYLKTLTINENGLEGFTTDQTDYSIWVPAGTSSINLGGSTISSKSNVQGFGNIAITKSEQTVIIKITAENGKVREYKITVHRPDGENVDLASIANQLGYRLTGNYISNLSFNTSVNTIKQKVNALSGTVQTIVQDSNGNAVSGRNIVTGDKIVLQNNGNSLAYTVTLYGDVNGDGKIDIVDLLLVQKIILGSSTLSEPYLRAANVNGDRGQVNVSASDIDIVDLLVVQKNILGAASVAQ